MFIYHKEMQVKAGMQLSTQNLIGLSYLMDCFDIYVISLLILYSRYVYLVLGAHLSLYLYYISYFPNIHLTSRL